MPNDIFFSKHSPHLYYYMAPQIILDFKKKLKKQRSKLRFEAS